MLLFFHKILYKLIIFIHIYFIFIQKVKIIHFLPSVIVIINFYLLKLWKDLIYLRLINDLIFHYTK